jgi:hypothetical protein
MSGRPIKPGDRIEEIDEHSAGIVVSVIGPALTYVVDYYNSVAGFGQFAQVSCDRVRVLPPVTDVKTAVDNILKDMHRLAKLEAHAILAGERMRPNPMRYHKPLPWLEKTPGQESAAGRAFTVLALQKAKDENGHQVGIGNLVTDTTNDISGIVVAIAGEALILHVADDDDYFATHSHQCTRQMSTKTVKGGA